MRPAQQGSQWSLKRVAERERYATYIESEEWFDRRRRWCLEYRERFGEDPSCAICGCPWTLERDDLHHMEYSSLGHERFEDLVGLCRRDHEDLHHTLESSPAWRRLNRRQAYRLIAVRLAQRQRERETL